MTPYADNIRVGNAVNGPCDGCTNGIGGDDGMCWGLTEEPCEHNQTAKQLPAL